MQRRHFLKLMLPAAALLAGCRPSASVDCLSNTAEGLRRLATFADPVLGEAAHRVLQTSDQKLLALGDACEAGFADHYRRQAAADFAAGNTVALDGWIVSETEALTHRAVYLASALPAAGSAP